MHLSMYVSRLILGSILVVPTFERRQEPRCVTYEGEVDERGPDLRLAVWARVGGCLSQVDATCKRYGEYLTLFNKGPTSLWWSSKAIGRERQEIEEGRWNIYALPIPRSERERPLSVDLSVTVCE